MRAACGGPGESEMRNWLKTALFVSAFSPSLMSIAASRIISEGFNWPSAYYGFAGFFGTLCTFYVVDALRWYGETFPFTAKKIESNDALMLAFVGTYFIPFAAKAADITPKLTLTLLGIAATVLWFSSSIPTSPLLRIFGFRFYKIESANGVVYTIITSREILDPAKVKTVKQISSSMLLEVV